MIPAKEIAYRLAQRAEAVAKYLFPNGKKTGNEYCIGSLNGEAGESLKICLSGGKAGKWSDFATGESGDLLNLFAIANGRNLSLAQAMQDAKIWLGIKDDRLEPISKATFAKPKQKWEIVKAGSSVFEYLTNTRKLTAKTINDFKIGELNNKIVFPYYRDNELAQVKYLSLERPNGKKQIHVEPNCKPCLFGWHAMPKGVRHVILTEGEIDCMALSQYGYPALSVPFGGGKGNKQQWLEYEFDRLAIYDEIYLCFDNDVEGQNAVDELIDRLGRHRCRIIKLPHKDANECLQKGVTTEEIKTCFDNAQNLDPSELKPANLYAEEVIKAFYAPEEQTGISPPWKKAKDKIFFRPNELSIWTGINGHGKSQFIGHIILHSMRQGAKVCIASLEIKPKRLLMRLTRQASALNEPAEEYIRAIHKWFTDKLWVFELVGTAKTKRILEVFKYARQKYGIDTFVIDSLLKCDISEDDYKAQKEFLDELCDFKNIHNCHIHLIAHPRKGVDESKSPNKLDVKGTGAITDLADNCFTIWRNKKKQNKLQEKDKQNIQPDRGLLDAPDCVWICDKQRNGEWEGKISLWFDPKSFQFLEFQTQNPNRYVNYSNRDEEQ